MKLKLVISCLFILLINLSGCASYPTKQQASKLDYGKPLTIDYQKAINDYYQDTLKDPDSAKIQIGSPRKVWVNEGLMFGQHVTGYGVDVSVNAKNSFGGYTGREYYLFIFKNNKINKIMPAGMVKANVVEAD